MSFKRTTRIREGTPAEEQEVVHSDDDLLDGACFITQLRKSPGSGWCGEPRRPGDCPLPSTERHGEPRVFSTRFGPRLRPDDVPFSRSIVKVLPLLLGGLVLSLVASCQRKSSLIFTEVASGLDYGHESVPAVPWSIHVVRIDRSHSEYSLQSLHANARAVGLSPLSEQLRQIPPSLGVPVAAINGDFYQRERAYMGDPRGLQISFGELLSAPKGGVAFWVGSDGNFQATNVSPHFEITWPDGRATAFGLNEERASTGLVLFTPAMGTSTHTTGGVEWLLRPAPADPWLPLRPNRMLSAVVAEVFTNGDTRLVPGTLVLSSGPALAKSLPALPIGAEVKLSTATLPTLGDIPTALSGGPMLVRDGQTLKLPTPTADSYEFNSMFERHPRSALGWNRSYFYLVEVDGRRKGVSVGMTLAELGKYLVQLGCEQAMNLDGGGSATLWCDGAVRNQPADGRERPIANALAVIRQPVNMRTNLPPTSLPVVPAR